MQQQLDKMNDLIMGGGASNKPKIDRPILITVLCLLLFVISGMQALTGFGVYLANKGLTMDTVSAYVKGDSGDELEAMQAPAAEQGTQEDMAVAEPPPVEWGIYYLVLGILIIVSVIGLWQMKQWGINVFATAMVVNIITLFIITPEWGGQSDGKPWWSLVLPAVYFIIVMPYRKKLGADAIDNESKAEV
jgi:hypothetical protein